MASGGPAACLTKACAILFTAVHEAVGARLPLVSTAVEIFSQLYDTGARPTDQSVSDAAVEAGFPRREAEILSIVWRTVLSLRSYEDGILVRPLNPRLL